jgi:hypothetical protein
VGLPRYGPNTDEVVALIRRLRRASPADATALAAGWDRLDGVGGAETLPWPADAWEFDFAAFEVSTALARRDAAAALRVADDATPAVAARLRDAAARTAHVVTLRPIFPPRTFARFRRAWEVLGLASRDEREDVRPTIRRA